MCIKMKAPNVGPTKAEKADANAERVRQRERRLRDIIAQRGQMLGRRSLISGNPGGAGFPGSAPATPTVRTPVTGG